MQGGISMKISAKGKYAIKLMVDLAMYNSGGPVRLKDIARRQDISVKYLEQIVSELSRAWLVKSTRGAGGGYTLAYAPNKYTVAQILKVTEGNLSPQACVGENAMPCENKATCVTSMIWEKLDKAIFDVLDNMTLEDLVDWQQQVAADYYTI